MLVNVNIMDDERADINNDLKKKKPDYNPYDDPEDDGFVSFILLFFSFFFLKKKE